MPAHHTQRRPVVVANDRLQNVYSVYEARCNWAGKVGSESQPLSRLVRGSVVNCPRTAAASTAISGAGLSFGLNPMRASCPGRCCQPRTAASGRALPGGLGRVASTFGATLCASSLSLALADQRSLGIDSVQLRPSTGGRLPCRLLAASPDRQAQNFGAPRS